MKVKTLAGFIFVLTIFYACKENTIEKAENNNNYFEASLDIVANKENTYGMYYTVAGSKDFSDKAPVWITVPGDDEVQRVTFKLPPNVKPELVRFDFNLHDEEEAVVLKQITLTYSGRKFDVAGPEIFTYFRHDSSKCKVNSETGKINPVVKNGVRQQPSLYPHEKSLAQQIELLVKKQ